MDEIKKAHELDPLSPRINANIGNFLFFERRYDEAVEELNKALELNPNDTAAHINLGQVYLKEGNKKQAVVELAKARQLEPQSVAAAFLVQAYAFVGEREQASKMVQEFADREKESYYSPAEIGFTCAALGEKDKAFVWLEKAYEQRDSRLVIHQADPLFDFLRSDPRMQDLLHRAGLLM